MVTLILKNNTALAYQFTVKKKKLTFVSKVECDFDAEQALNDPEYFLNFLKINFYNNKFLKNEPYNVLLDCTDIQYRTSHFSNLELSMDNDKSQYEENLLIKTRLSLPKEITELYPELTTAILAIHESKDGLTVTSAHIEADVIRAIRMAFTEANLGLMAISPKVYGVFNALFSSSDFIVVNEQNYIASINYQGLYVWPKPEDNKLTDEDTMNFIQKEVADHFSIGTANFVNFEDENFEEIIRSEINSDEQDFNDKDLLAAFGSNLPVKDLNKEEISEDTEDLDETDNKKKGVFANVLNQLRELFNSEGTEDL